MRSLPAVMLLALSCRLFAQGLPASAESGFDADMRSISSFHPRLEGSPEEKKALAFISGRLAEIGTWYSQFDFTRSDSFHSYSACIRVDVRGTREDTLIVAVPLNGPKGSGMDADGAVNIALALELLRAIRRSPPEISVTVLFLGAEFGPTADYPLGSRLFLAGYEKSRPTAVMYLNFTSIPRRIAIRGGGTGIVSPYWIMDRSVEAMKAARIPYLLRGNENLIFRLGLRGEKTIIEPFLSEGYPSISLESAGGEAAAADGSVPDFGAFFASFLNAGEIPGEWDKHYLLFQEGGFTFLITEKAYVATLLLVLSGSLLYSLVFRKGLKKYTRTLVRNSWSILPLLAIPFLFLLVSTYALEGILALRGFPTLWTYSPLVFLSLKLCIPLLIYTLMSGLIRRIPFSRKGSFYSAAALFFLLIDIVVVAVINIAFSFFFIWAFVFLLLAAMVPTRWGKLLLFPPSAFLGIRGLMEFFLMPALPFCRFILLSPIEGNLLIAAVILPFVLYGVRLGLIFRGRGIFRRRVRRAVFSAALSAAVVGLTAYLCLGSPFTPSHPQPVTVTQVLDEDGGRNRLELESPAPIGKTVIRSSAGENVLNIPSAATAIELVPRAAPVELSAAGAVFLNKKNFTVEAVPQSSPSWVTARLTSAEEFILLDCSVPFARENSREYRLLIGAHPPTPLVIQLTLPEGKSYTLTMVMEFDAPLLGVEVSFPTAGISTRLHVVKGLSLKT